MSDTTPQQKANLARIRDNQRRSRARRKEYLQELETKYRSCEAVGAEASAEIQAAARKVLDENKRLRRLLRQQGFSDADIDGPDHDEYASSPSAVEMLDVMLVTRKPCRPSSVGGCGDSSAFKTEDEDDLDSRRQSCASTSASAAPVPLAPQTQQHRPIALAPAPANQPRSRPQSHDPVLQQHHHLQPQPQPQQQPQQLQHQLPPQIQQSMQFQGQPVQHQQVQAQQQMPPQQHQQFFMTPPSHASAPPLPLQNAHTSPGAFVQEYPLYAPQPFGYAVQSQLLDWDMAAAEAMPQSGTYTTPGTYASPTAGYPTAASFASPTPTVSTGYNTQDNTSSCFTAADAIRTLHVDAGPEVETALGCRDGTRDCRVNNSMVFDLMDRYAGAQGQQSGM
ncbi:hypothetical protein D6D25_05835 [Aureobasidium pullulans]|nr:hypothetical protein D6D25_05835 [Aureobasidium pullulans]